jgi:hypothetical protein
MKFEFYQVLVPVISFVFILELVRKFRNSKTSPQEAFAGSMFWIALAVLAMFPDYFSKLTAEFFGIKNNVNAVVFLCLGLIFFFQYRLFFMLKRHQTELTKLTRKIALKEEEKENEV